jgi:hypothetical protein
MEVLVHINLSFSLMAFSNFNFLIEMDTDTENEPRYIYILTFQMSGLMRIKTEIWSWLARMSNINFSVL